MILIMYFCVEVFYFPRSSFVSPVCLSIAKSVPTGISFLWSGTVVRFLEMLWYIITWLPVIWSCSHQWFSRNIIMFFGLYCFINGDWRYKSRLHFRCDIFSMLLEGSYISNYSVFYYLSCLFHTFSVWNTAR